MEQYNIYLTLNVQLIRNFPNLRFGYVISQQIFDITYPDFKKINFFSVYKLLLDIF